MVRVSMISMQYFILTKILQRNNLYPMQLYPPPMFKPLFHVDLEQSAHAQGAHSTILPAKHNQPPNAALVPLAPVHNVLSNILKDESFRLVSTADCRHLVLLSVCLHPRPGL